MKLRLPAAARAVFSAALLLAAALPLLAASVLTTGPAELAARPAPVMPSLPATPQPPLPADVVRLRADLAAATQENERLRAALAENTMRLSLREDDLAAVNRQLANARPGSARAATPPPADADPAQLRAERDRLGAQLAETQAARAELQRQLEQSATKLFSTQRELAARPDDAALKSLATERDALKERAAAQQAQIDRLRTERDQWQLAARDATAARADLEHKLASPGSGADPAALRQQLADTEEKLAAALRAFTLRQDEVDRLQNALASVDAERATTAAKLAAVETERASLAAKAVTAPPPEAEAAALRDRLAAATKAEDERRAAQQQQFSSIAVAHARELDTLRAQLRQTQAAAVAAPAAPNIPPAEAAAPRIHTVAAGDSLGKIARQYYGTSTRWPEILDANRAALKNPDLLPLGAKLQIP